MNTDLCLIIILLALAGTAASILWLAVLDARRARWLDEHPEEAERLVLDRIARRGRRS